MNQSEFIQAVSSLTGYRWTRKGNQILGKAKNGINRGGLYNPITALARTRRLGDWLPNRAGTAAAANALGLSPSLANAIISNSHRGHSQVILGRLSTALLA